MQTILPKYVIFSLGYIFYCLWGCSSTALSREELTLALEQSAPEIFSPGDERGIDLLEDLLDQVLLEDKKGNSCEQAHNLLCRAIERYQLYFFISPSSNRLQKLNQYYSFWDSKKTSTPEQSAFYKNQSEFYKMREIIERVQQKSALAAAACEKILAQWEQNLQSWESFLQEIASPYEIGGIFLQEKDLSIQSIFIEDASRKALRQYLTEFRQNDFRHWPILEKKFRERLTIRKTGADSKTLTYSNVILQNAEEKFAIIRAFAAKDSLSQAEMELLEKTKKKLYFFGLEKKLLHHSYSLDMQKYIARPDLVFFFHTHPYDARLPHAKKPSGQDETMTFRCGPMLIFDIHQERIDMYSSILGESKKVKTFLVALPE